MTRDGAEGLLEHEACHFGAQRRREIIEQFDLVEALVLFEEEGIVLLDTHPETLRQTAPSDVLFHRVVLLLDHNGAHA